MRSPALLLSLAALALAAPAPAPAAAPRAPRALATMQGVAAARAYAQTRAGLVAFAVLDGRGHLRGLRMSTQFSSASVVKAMLLVAELRRAGSRPLTAAQRRALEPMIRASDNDAAHLVYGWVGAPGLRRVAGVARMHRFAVGRFLFDARVTAADQARFFLHIDRLVPAAHRRYARRLLSSIVSWQRWGIATVARRRGMTILFKGGWRTGLSHQVALLERGRRRVALAILTSGQPSAAYAQETSPVSPAAYSPERSRLAERLTQA